MEWIRLNGRNYPPEKETLWCYNENDDSVWLGDYCYLENVGWFWTTGTGLIYTSGNRIVAEAEWDDDMEPTHWQPLPTLPGREQER